MGRRSEMATLVERTEASPEARERTKVILLTLARHWSVQDGCARLGVGRTRFQDLRRRMLRGAARALEEGAAGRPRRHEDRAYGETRGLRRRIAELERELRRSEAELDIARSEAGRAVERRLAAKAVR